MFAKSRQKVEVAENTGSSTFFPRGSWDMGFCTNFKKGLYQDRIQGTLEHFLFGVPAVLKEDFKSSNNFFAFAFSLTWELAKFKKAKFINVYQELTNFGLNLLFFV